MFENIYIQIDDKLLHSGKNPSQSPIGLFTWCNFNTNGNHCIIILVYTYAFECNVQHIDVQFNSGSVCIKFENIDCQPPLWSIHVEMLNYGQQR